MNIFPTRTIKVPRGLISRPKLSRTVVPLIAKPVFPHIGPTGPSIQRLPGGRIKSQRPTAVRPPRRPYNRGIPTRNAWVHPKDRIAKWSIGPGDSVRIISGADKFKFNDEAVGKASGWKIYTVKNVDQTLNRVYLDGLTRKTSVPDPVKPPDFDEWSEDEKAEWQRDNGREDPHRSVQVSNLGLLVEKHPDDPTLHVWAKRVKTTAARFDRETKTWKWDRYASAVTGETSIPRSEKGWKIQWPEKKKDEENSEGQEATDYTADDVATLNVTYKPLQPDHLIDPSKFEAVIPTTLRAKPTNDRYFQDVYLYNLRSPEKRDEVLVDNLMPIYLSEELSPRFSKAKRDAAWEAKQIVAKQRKQEFIDRAVREWKDNGRDRNLRHVMNSSLANLAGVPLKFRSLAEVKETAALEYDTQQLEEAAFVARKIKDGFVFDYDTLTWVPGPKQRKIIFKRENKVKKEERKLKRLETMQLVPKKNMYVPPEILGTKEEASTRS